MPERLTAGVQLSIVATIYRTGPYLHEFVERAFSAAKVAGFAPNQTEVVLVNDGTPDNGLDIALSLHEVDPRVVVVDLSRNFGHHKAMMMGCQQAHGEFVFLIDSDLEESPEWLPDFATHLREHKADMVYGVQETRKGSGFERYSGDIFYKVFNALSSHKVKENSVTARLMTRRFVTALIRHREQSPFLFGLCALTGFHQLPYIINKASTSPTTYTLVRKLRLATQCITSFSSRPLVLIATLGACMTGLAFSYVLFLLLRQWLWGVAPEGWTTVIASIWLVGGMLMLSLGIISLYLATLFTEVKKRPYAIIRHVHRQSSGKSPS